MHGIGNRQPDRTPADEAAILGGRWTAALRRGLGARSRLEAVVANYAHHLAGETAQGVIDPAQLTEPDGLFERDLLPLVAGP